MFGFGDDQKNITDDDLVRAIRARMLEDIKKKADAERIVNNVYGGPIVGGGIAEQMGPQPGDPVGSPADRDYFVDIMRQDYEPGDEAMVIDPATGQQIPQKLARGGWSKRVHRFSSPKKKAT